MTDAPETVTDALQLLEAEGYDHAVYLLDDGHLRFAGQDRLCPLDDVVVERMFRFEGDSDPGDEMVVFGVHDPVLGLRGTLASAFGLAADPDVLRHLTYIAGKVDPR